MQGNIQTPSRALRSDIGFVHYIVGSVPASLKVVSVCLLVISRTER